MTCICLKLQFKPVTYAFFPSFVFVGGMKIVQRGYGLQERSKCISVSYDLLSVCVLLW